MQIHEITKVPQRTDEGILDGLKNAYNAAKTGFKAAGDAYQNNQWNTQQNKINKDAQKSAAILARKGFNVDTKTPLSAAPSPQNIQTGTAGPKFKQNILLQQFLNTFVGPPTPAVNSPATTNNTASSNTMANAPVSKTNVAQSGNPNLKVAAQNTMANAPVSVSNKAKAGNPNLQGTTPNTMANAPVSVSNKAKAGNPNLQGTTPNTMANAPVSKTNVAQPGNPNIAAQPPVAAAPVKTRTGGKIPGQISQTPNAIRKRAARLKEDGEAIKDIETEFPDWIDSKIPGLRQAKQDPEQKLKLDQAFNSLIAAKGNPKTLSTAFDNYIAIANQAIAKSQGRETNRPGVSGNAPSYTSQLKAQRELSKVGLDPKVANILKQKLDTGALTPDALIHAITNS
jgi:hypothetical protein